MFSKPLGLAAKRREKKVKRKFQMNEMLPEERQIARTLNPWLKLRFCDRTGTEVCILKVSETQQRISKKEGDKMDKSESMTESGESKLCT